MTDHGIRAKRVKRAGHSPLDWLISKTNGAERLFALAEGKLLKGSARLILPDGSSHLFTGPEPGPAAVFHILHWRALGRMATGGALGFARSYIDGDWETPDLAAVCALASVNRESMAHHLRGSMALRLLDRMRHLLRANSRSRARKNIAFHYDLGNAFYSPWLDETMTYSSGLFKAGEQDLEAAQLCKYRRLLDVIDVKPGEHILEIGAGWGGFAEIAAKERGARVTGLTLSREQLDFANDRMARLGLSDQVEFVLRDYRDETGRYDHVVSIEMFEAVGEAYWPVYFETLHRVLKPGGRAGLQIITIDEKLFPAYRKSADFIQTYIFPGGMLPTVSALKHEVAHAGLVLKDMMGFADSYAQTLALWRLRFNEQFERGALPEGFDEMFRRLWSFYLAYCEGGFRGGSIDVVQLALTRDGD
ncbi:MULTISPECIES: cyclopropane-fatty-acyl-phospholipid synthase family protein [unclassified Iodidimonas]|jgi:cyclopropane-fatty-acyl-phospholipid synthase|uniref:class I SAM-dependent methyltransferase n=1 Tax=unclassified Iodidimonas TaxID=2626145 RepID=UPI002482B5F4|nr:MULTISPECIES: cyclopropane-fatty-acyl-phospholipid synthase family protein [unclassified Iodidimonas]